MKYGGAEGIMAYEQSTKPFLIESVKNTKVIDNNDFSSFTLPVNYMFTNNFA